MIVLKPKADRRVRGGHLWIFANEIADPRVSELAPGSIHELLDATGEFVGVVYANPVSLIAARILSRRKTTIDTVFFLDRIQSALDLRRRLFPDRTCYRVVFGESDLLPGLIVDRYGEIVVAQALTAGVERLLEAIVNAIVEVLAPAGIYLRNDSSFRLLEGLPLEKRLLWGTVPERVEIESRGLRFVVDVVNGQKTGFFLDQESNRELMRQYVTPGMKVLDLFCYTGAWALHALAAGADHATGVDSSRGALDLATLNAALNNSTYKFLAVRDQAVDFLKKTRESWDLVVVDPPAFIKTRAQLREGRKGYIDVNRRALRRLRPGGILVTCSCSHHVDLSLFEEILISASRQSGRRLRILDVRGQGPDHPVLPDMPETRYLKVFVAQAF
ncbi:MAG: class I SAM-dependent rRNA methyltransferase [Deltaproteobacteria bacterium]|nr:class I SAM-dependent rRNA methyltransferase [Deltaproteobacteria bacterium]